MEGPAQLNELRIDWDGGGGGVGGGGVVRGCCTEPQKATSKLGWTALTLVLSSHIQLEQQSFNRELAKRDPDLKVIRRLTFGGGISQPDLAGSYQFLDLDPVSPSLSTYLARILTRFTLQSIANNNCRLLMFNFTFLLTTKYFKHNTPDIPQHNFCASP